MGESLETLLAWVLLIAMAVGITWLFRLKKRREGQRSRDLVAAAVPLGLTPVRIDKKFPRPPLADFWCFSEGDWTNTTNRLAGTVDGARFQLFDVISLTGYDQSAKETVRTLAVVESERFRLPWLTVQPKRFLTASTGGQPVLLDDHPGLKDNYLIRAADTAAASALLSEPLVQFLEAHPGRGFEANDRLFAWFPASSATGSNRVEPQGLAAFFDEARSLARVLAQAGSDRAVENAPNADRPPPSRTDGQPAAA